MRITVGSKHKQINSTAISKTKVKVAASLSKFGALVKSVEFFFEDVNGPRGGVDKECRILVKLRKMDSVAVSVKDETFSKAISRAINRAERAVGRKIQRRSLRESGRRSELGFAFFK